MRRPDERGVALLLVLLILALLVPLILEFDADARRELREAAAFRDGFKAVALARSGTQLARAVLKYDAQLDVQANRAYDALTDIWASPISNYRIGDGFINAQIEDERAKLNLNDFALEGDAAAKLAKVARLKRLFASVQVDPRLVDAVVDWVDRNEEPEPNGAESSYYQSLSPPYRAANGRLQTLDELYLVKGFTDESVKRLRPYLTVYPPDGQVNVNTADTLVLQALDQRITPALALDLIRARPFTSIQDLDRVKSIEALAKELRTFGVYTVRSDVYQARVSATVNEVTKTSRAVIQRNAAGGQSGVTYWRIE